MKRKVLITGASGFVGSRIAGCLMRDETKEVSLLLRDPDAPVRLFHPGAKIFKGDITSVGTLRQALRGQEIIIHSAALMSNYESEPKSEFYKVNVAGTKNVLESCDLSALRQFIHISTAGVYGPTGANGVDEEAPYGKTLSIYERSKKEAETELLKYVKEKNIPYTILRPSQLYGSGMRYGWPDTIRSIRRGGMPIPGNGRAMMHLLHIKDLVRAVELAAGNARAINSIYNIAGPEVLSLEDIFGKISAALAVRRARKIPYLPVYLASLLLSFVPYGIKSGRLRLLTPHRVGFFAADHVYTTSKARSEIGYNPAIGVKEGFDEVINWLRDEDLL